MDKEYKTTIKIINNKKDNLLFKEVANRLKNKETKLKGKAITNKTTNFASKGRKGYKGRKGRGRYKGPHGLEEGCYACKGPY